MSDSPYANPQPYDTPELERAALEGRIATAKKIRDLSANAGNTRSAASWQANVDTLLEKLAFVDERAASAAMDQSLREGSGQ